MCQDVSRCVKMCQDVSCSCQAFSCNTRHFMRHFICAGLPVHFIQSRGGISAPEPSFHGASFRLMVIKMIFIWRSSHVITIAGSFFASLAFVQPFRSSNRTWKISENLGNTFLWDVAAGERQAGGKVGREAALYWASLRPQHHQTEPSHASLFSNILQRHTTINKAFNGNLNSILFSTLRAPAGLMEVEVKSRLELASGSQACSVLCPGIAKVREVMISKLLETTPGWFELA